MHRISHPIIQSTAGIAAADSQWPGQVAGFTRLAAAATSAALIATADDRRAVADIEVAAAHRGVVAEQAGRVLLVQRIVADIGVPVEPIGIPGGVGL